jgi:ferredoxin
MKVIVNPMVCAGYGICAGVLPELFQIGGDGHGYANVLEVPADLEDAVRSTAQRCPTGAIVVAES